MNLVIFIFLALIVLVIARNLQQKYAEQKYKYKVFQLRDQLRMAAINDEIDCNSNIYNYLDNSLSNHIKRRKYYTLFYLITLTLKHSNDESIMEKKKLILNDINDNPILLEIFNEFQIALSGYVIRQHKIIFNSVIIPILAPISIIARLVKFVKESIYYPEITSSDGLNIA